MVNQGLELDNNFDLVVDNTGDVSAVSEVEETNKDLSARISGIVDTYVVGSVISDNAIVEVETRIEDLVSNDPRIVDVVSISLEPGTRDEDPKVAVEANSIFGFLSFTV